MNIQSLKEWIIQNYRELAQSRSKKNALKIIESGLQAASPNLGLEKHLKNDKIKIEVEISENPKQEQIYTPTEKYQYLLQLNPQLEELRKKFANIRNANYV